MILQVKCPHCQAVDAERTDYGIAVDAIPPVYYTEYRCRNCLQWFAIKSNDENTLLAIIKDFQVGRFYPDGMGLEGQGAT